MTAADRNTVDVRPKWRQDTVFLPWGDGAFLRSPERAAQLDGAGAYRLLARLSPYLNGEWTLEQICAGLGGAQRAAVGALMVGLLDKGFILDAGRRAELPTNPGRARRSLEPAVAARFRTQLEYLDHLSADAVPRFVRFRTARILLAGNGVSLHAAATGLLRNGAARVDVTPDTSDWAHTHALQGEAQQLRDDGLWISLRIDPGHDPGAGYDLVLYCADCGGAAPVIELNRRCHAGGPSLVPMVTLGSWGLLGPVVRPNTAGCWWCASLRLAATPSTSVGSTADADELITPTVAWMLGGAAAFEAFRLLTGALPVDTDGAVIVQELRTLEATRVRLPPDPGCPVCAGTTVSACSTELQGSAQELPQRLQRPGMHLSEPGRDVASVVDDPLPTLPQEADRHQPSQQDAGIVRDYAEAAFRVARQPMAPVGFTPDWTDQPAVHKTYPDALMIPLPDRPPRSERSLAEAHSAPRAALPGVGTMEQLAWLLRMSYGVLARRLRLDWNHAAAVRSHYPTAFWSRGTVSGGGLYPLEIYWVAGDGGPLPPGIYHYATGHHALEQLTVGDVTDHVRTAVHQHSDTRQTDQFLLVSFRFWRNAFKYANLSYHVGTLDLGALLGSWDLLGAGLGMPIRRVLWFDDEALNALLGLETAEESVVAVVTLPWGDPPAGLPSGAVAEAAPSVVASIGMPPVAFERSRTVLRFSWLQRVHQTTLVAGDPRPDPDAGRRARVGAPGAPLGRRPEAEVALPRPSRDRLTEPVSALLARRRSSSGGLVAVPPLELWQLGTVLDLAARARNYCSDLASDAEPGDWTRLSVLANHVARLAPAGYQYDSAGHALHRVEPGIPDAQWSVFLRRAGAALMNYNLDQAAAVLVISGRLEAMLSSYGARGYRVLNAEAGSVAQASYLAATALGLGCGAVLNLDNVLISGALGFEGTDERTVLCLLIGGDRGGHADLDYRLG